MESRNDRNIIRFIGDFYESSAAKDRIAMNKALDYIENLIGHGEADSEIVREHFNEVFSGRQAYNTMLNVEEYPAESVIRELFQNAFDCCYDSKDIKLAVNLKSGNIVSISYNETGFTFENFLRYLGFGLNYGQEGAEYREGRFGIGAKSVFSNVEWLSMRSNNISFRISNNGKVLSIDELDLKRSLFMGTEIVFKVTQEHHDAIRENLMTLADKKGAYINIPELCFAFNRKKVLNYNKNNMEAKDRTFNIAVLDDGKLAAFYKLFKYKSRTANAEVIRFMRNNKNVVDFICEEGQDLIYLIPFAVSSIAKEGVLKVLGDKYNYFSTYELTGLMKNKNEAIADEKLSSFFISVPNDYITSFRTGVRHDREGDVKVRVEADLTEIISKYKQYFVLVVGPLANNSGYCYMRPDSYAFEFIKSFIMKSRFAADFKNGFQRGISVLLRGEDEAVPYGELIETAYAGRVEGITEEEHMSGFAYREHIEKELASMRTLAEESEVKTLYAGYTWTNTNGAEKTVFRYEFYRKGRVLVVDSLKNPSIQDFNLHYRFPSVTGRIIKNHLGENNAVEDDNVLISLIKLLDERYDGKYMITTKTPRLCVSFGEEEYQLSLETMKINNIAAVMEALASHRYRFDTNLAYSEAEKLFISIFCGDGTIAELLKGIKANGGEVTVEYNAEMQPYFSAYGRKFQITDDLSVKDLADIIGVDAVFKDYSLICGRTFGFKCGKIGYVFEKDDVLRALHLSENDGERVNFALSRIFICDLGISAAVVLDENENVSKVSGLSHDDEISCSKGNVVILKNDLTKTETADIIETIICGENKGALSGSLERARSVNIIIGDNNGTSDISPSDLRDLATRLGDMMAAETSGGTGALFAADLHGFSGFGGCCTACGFKSRVTNPFSIKEFRVILGEGGRERYFTLTLFLCENCAITSNAWFIKNVTIGGLSPFDRLDRLTKDESLSDEVREVIVTYKEQTVDYGNEENSAVISEEKSFKFNLQPLLLAKWVRDIVL